MKSKGEFADIGKISFNRRVSFEEWHGFI